MLEEEMEPYLAQIIHSVKQKLSVIGGRQIYDQDPYSYIQGWLSLGEGQKDFTDLRQSSLMLWELQKIELP